MSTWILELYANEEKTDLLKVYQFATVRQIAYILDEESTVVFNCYHSLIKPRGNLRYVNIFKRKKVS